MKMKSSAQISANTVWRVCPFFSQQRIMTAVAILLAGFLSLCGFSQASAADSAVNLQSASITDAEGKNPPPVVSFTYTINDSSVTFNASVASGNAIEFNWDFGDNTNAKGQTATHQYINLGTYQVTLTAIDQNGSVKIWKSDVNLAPQPTPESDVVVSSHKAITVGNLTLTYKGAFRLPQGIPKEAKGCDSSSDCNFAYGGAPFAVDPKGNNGAGSLFIGSQGKKIAEISIPEPKESENLKDLNTAGFIQGFKDITEGNRYRILSDKQTYGGSVGEVPSGGLMVYDGKLFGSVYIYYPGPEQFLSHYVSNKDLSAAGGFSGMYKIAGSTPSGGFIPARYLANYMDTIPDNNSGSNYTNWQENLGGKAITGGGSIPIISTTSAGPSAFVLDPALFNLTVGPKTDDGDRNVPATTLMYYPLENRLGDPPPNSNLNKPVYNLTAHINGVTFPDGTDTVLFFGVIGSGEYCYGIGTSNHNLVGQPVPSSTYGEKYDCYDPGDSSKGNHAYPYLYQVWAYNAHDFVKVKDGKLKPWEVIPREILRFNLPFQPGRASILGTSYDREHQKLYIAQAMGDDPRPLVHVYLIETPK